MRFNNSPPVCKYFLNSECTNPNCRFLHPLEYPVYIYSTPGIEIHPDELRLAVMMDPSMTTQADTVWLNNFNVFNMEPGEKGFELLECPDYFCMPFDVERVFKEIEQMKNNRNYTRGGQEYRERSFDNSRTFDRQFDNRSFSNRPFNNRQQFDNRQPFRKSNYGQDGNINSINSNSNTWGSKFNENTQYRSNTSMPYNRGGSTDFNPTRGGSTDFNPTRGGSNDFNQPRGGSTDFNQPRGGSTDFNPTRGGSDYNNRSSNFRNNDFNNRNDYNNRGNFNSANSFNNRNDFNSANNFNNYTSFDRKPDTNSHQSDNTEKEYEYQNIPYNYK